MKTYFKTLVRMFSKHFSRFLSISCLVVLAVGFVSGIGSATDMIDDSLSAYYRESNVSDFIVKCTGEGFSEEDVAAVRSIFSDDPVPSEVATGLSFDYERKYTDGNGEEKTETLRLYFLDGFSEEEWTVNVPRTLEKAQVSEEESPAAVAYAEQSDNVLRGYALLEEITLDFTEIIESLSFQKRGEGLSSQEKTMLSAFISPVTVTVTRTVSSPLTFGKDGEPSYIRKEGEDLSSVENVMDLKKVNCIGNVLYLSSDLIPETPSFLPGMGGKKLLGTGDIYIAIGDRSRFEPFGKEYERYVEEKKTEITELLSENGESYAEVITLSDNVSFSMIHSYSEKVKGIGFVMMIAFLLVTALVVVSNMLRLIEEERAQIACLSTLGYSPILIVFRYLLFAAISTGIGGFGGYFVNRGLAYLLYFAFGFSFDMPPISFGFSVGFHLAVFFAVFAVILFSTGFSGLKTLRETPAELLRPKAPKPGKKVIVERIPFIWKRLSFKYKSTVRNVLRYKNRFFMTVFSVAFSTALVIAGLAILDLCLFGELASPTIVAVALVVMIFAGLLTVTVVYTLTSINISERNRELATLMVLGYYDGEVSGYVYREILIDTLIGIVFGYPFSFLLTGMVFNVIGLGSIGGISWFMWLIAPPAVLAFSFIVGLVLRKKIVRIDMNESLKAVE
ncbi:MAG: FtsX-like permease family protein [Candidatus Borkfalkiaceae bacterium]|nr:FtsX-like permease family protein [Christensenellaceae bacterium]